MNSSAYNERIFEVERGELRCWANLRLRFNTILNDETSGDIAHPRDYDIKSNEPGLRASVARPHHSASLQLIFMRGIKRDDFAFTSTGLAPH